MTIPASLAALTGQWAGDNQLWFDPNEPSHASATTLTVAPAAEGKFLTLSYTWAFDGAPQAGLLVLGLDGATVRMSWIDSFHMGDAIMALTGAAGDDSRVSAQGSYAAPDGPDWGWQIAVAALPDGRLQLLMHNIQPGEAPQKAVEAVYTRTTP